jgi:glutamyl/glutaminyl-tRNA synthetase
MSEDFDYSQFLSGEYDEDPDEGDQSNQQQETPLVKQLRKQLNDLGKQLKTLTKENDTLKSEKEDRALESTWNELNVPEKVRQFYTGEKTAEAVKQWVEDNKEVFNLQPPEDSGSGSETDEQKQQKQELQGATKAATTGTDQGHSLGLDAIKAKAQEVAKSSRNKNATGLDELFEMMNVAKGGTQVPRQE